jgi:hypothetical protein
VGRVHNDGNYFHLLTHLDDRATLLFKFARKLIVHLDVTSGFAVPLSHVEVEAFFIQW